MHIKEVSVVVPSKSYTVTKYIAEDGEDFPTEMACLLHEHKLAVSQKMSSIKTFYADLYPFLEMFYFIDSQDTLDFLVKEEFCGDITVRGNHIQIGDWVACHVDYNPDGRDNYYLTTLNEINGAIDIRGIE